MKKLRHLNVLVPLLILIGLISLGSPSFAAGSLTGATSTPSTANFTTEGTADWVHWGDGSIPGLNRKSTGGTQISGYTAVNGGTIGTFSNANIAITWTDGTPTSSSTSDTTGIYVPGVNDGFSFTVPADTVSRTLRVYVGAANARGKLTAHLSDSSASDYVDTSLNDTGSMGGGTPYEYTLTFKANSASQTLTVTWIVGTDHGSGNISIQGVTLQGGAPVINSISPTSGATRGGLTGIVISGYNLGSATSVTFGASAATITANTANSITVTDPSGSGATTVTVTTASGSGTTTYTYQDPSWNGGGADAKWTTTANWSTSLVPYSTDDVTIGTAFTSGTALLLNGAESANSLTLSNTSNITLDNSGSAVNLTLASGNITKSSASTGTTIFNANAKIALGANGTISNSGGKLTVNSIISGAYGLTYSGTGTTALGGANTYTGTTTINSGTLNIAAAAPSGSAGALGNASSAVLLGNTSGSSNATLDINGAYTVGRAVTVQSGNSGTQTISEDGSASGTISGNIAVNNAVTFNAVNSGDSLTLSGVISGGSNVTIGSGAGTVTFSNTNTYTGTTTVNGTLNLSSGSTASGSAVTVNGTVKGTGTINGAITVASGGYLEPGTFTAGSTITVNSGGTFRPGVNTAVTWTTQGITFNTGSTAEFYLNGTSSYSTVNVTGNIACAGTLNIDAGGSLAAGNYTLFTCSGTRSGTFTLGTMPSGFTGALTYTGTTVLLIVGIVRTWTGLGANANEDTAGNWDTLPAATDNVSIGTGFSSGTTLNLDSPTNANPTTNSVTFTQSPNIIITNTGSFAVLTITSGYVIGSASGTTTFTSNAGIGLGASGVFSNNGSGIYFNGVISGGYSLTLTGSGIIGLGAANTYTGATTIDDGTLEIDANAPSGSAGALGNASSAVLLGNTGGSNNATININGAYTVGRSITVQSGNSGTMTIEEAGAAIGTISGAIAVNNATTFTASSASDTLTLSGIISGGSNVTVSGSGAVVMSNTNTYTGTTTVNGTLKVSGSTASGSAVTVASGGKLEGNGTVNGTVTVQSGGTLYPGTGTAATLSTGALTLNSGSTSSYYLNTTGASAKTAVTGNLTLGGTINVTGGGSFGVGTYTIFTYTGSVSGTLTVGTMPAGYYGTITTGGGNVNLVVVSPSWNGGGADSKWTTTANWNIAAVPATTDDLTFGTAFTSGTTVYLNGAETANSATISTTSNIVFDNSSTAVNLTLTSGNLTKSSASTGTTTFNANAGIALGANGTISNSGGNLTFNDVISGAYNLTFTGSGTTALAGANTYTGTTSILAGTVNENASSTSGAAGVFGNSSSIVYLGDTSGSSAASLILTGAYTEGHPITVQTGSSGTKTITENGGVTGTVSGNVTANGAVTLTSTNSSDNLNMSGVVSGGGNITISGSGKVTYSNTNTYTGTTTVNGTLNLSSGSIASGSAVTISNLGYITGSGTINGTTSISSGGYLEATTLTANGTITVTSGGTFRPGVLTAATWTTKAVTFNAGANAEFYLNGTSSYSTVNMTGALTCAGTLYIDSGASFSTGTYTLFTCTGTPSGTFTLGTMPTGYSGVLNYNSGSVTLVVTGPTISGISPNTGATRGGITGVVISGTNLGSATSVTFGSNAATITANTSTSITVTTPVGSGAVTVTVTTAAGTATTTYTYRDPSWNGGGADAKWTTTANWSTSQVPYTTDDVTFGTAFTSGTSILLNGAETANSMTISTTSNITFDNTGSAVNLTLTSGNITKSSASTGTTTFNANAGIALGANGTISNSGGNLTINSVISGGYALTFSGTGTTILGGTNTYSGTTTVNGTLKVSGSTASGSAVTVASGGTLEGSGTVNGTVSVSSGGTLYPGTGTAATLSTGALTLNSGSTSSYYLNTTGASAKTAVTGNLTLGGTINVTAGASFAVGTYVIFTYTGTVSGTLTVGTMPSGYSATVTTGSGNVNLVVTGPTISGISPNTGATRGGITGVVISGTNLASATSVTFGSNAATITANTSTSITVTTPAGSGATTVTVTTAGGTATTTYTYQDPSWNGGGADAKWTTTGNWSTSQVPYTTDDVTFGTAFTSGTSLLLNGAESANSMTISTTSNITFDNTGSAVNLTLASGNLTKSSASTGTTTFNANAGIALGANGTISNSGGNLTINSVISGAYNLATAGSGTIILGGTNTFGGSSNSFKVGNTTTVKVSADNNMGDSTNIVQMYGTLASTATFSTARSFSILSGSKFDVASGTTLTLSGVISGGGSDVNKISAGTLVLSNTDTYTGTTSVTNGTLNVTGSTSSSSAVTVYTGATLTGTGTVAGTVTVQSGGTINPGNGAAATLSTGALTLNSGSTSSYYLNTTGASAKTAVTGNLSLGGTINVTGGASFGAGTYTIFTYTGSVSGTLTVGTMPTGYSGTVTTGGGNVNLVVSGPTITNISPTSGPTRGGITGVVITGTNLASATSVTFGASAATITANTSTSITVTTPAGSGAVTVTVTTAAGTATTTYTYQDPSWNGGGSDANWTTTSNWSTGLVPATNDDVTFGTAFTSGTTVYLNGAETANSATISTTSNIAFDNSGSAVNLTLTTGNLTKTSASTGTTTFNANAKIALGANGTISNSGGNLTINSIISGAYNLTTAGSGTIILSGVNTFGGSSNIFTVGNTTIVKVSADSAMGNSTNSVNMKGTLATTATFTSARAYSIVSGSRYDVASGTTLTLSGVISGSGSDVNKTSAGTLILSNTDTYTGTTSVTNGTLNVTGSTSSSSAVTVYTGATLTGTGTVAGTVTVQSGGTLYPGTGTAATLSTGALTLNSGSTSSYYLNTTGASAKTAVTGNLSLGGTINVTGGASFGTGTYVIFTYTGTVSGTLTVGTMPTGYSGTITTGSGNVNLVVTGPSITGISPNTGATRGGITGVVISGTNLGSASSVTFGSNAATITANTSTSITVTTPAGSGAVTVTVTTAAGTATTTYTYQDPSWNGGGADSKWTTTANWSTGVAPYTTDDVTFGTAFTSGTTLYLNGAETANSATISTTSNIIFDNSGSAVNLTLTSGNLTKSSASTGTTTFNANAGIILGANGTISNSGGNLTINSVISGAYNLTISGTGTTILGGANTLGGSSNSVTISSSSTLQIAADNNLGNSTNTVSIGGTLATTSTFSSARTISLTASATINTSSSTTLTLSGVLSGGNNLTKTGAGTLTLSNTNTYSGTTTVSAGVLNITGSTASGSAVTVSNSGTLEGTGTVNGSVSVSSGGTFYPGTGTAATLSTGALTLNSGSTSSYYLNTTGASAKTAVTGNLTLGGTINVTGGGSFGTGTYTLFTYTGTLSGSLTIGATPGGYDYTITSGGGVVSLVVNTPTNLTLTLAVSPSGTQPPGTDLVYTTTFTNPATNAASNVIVIVPIPSNTDFKVNSPSSSLGTTGVTVAVSYSNNSGSTWTYTPASGSGGAASGYDRNVTNIRWVFTGNVSGTSPNNTGSLSFTVMIR